MTKSRRDVLKAALSGAAILPAAAAATTPAGLVSAASCSTRLTLPRWGVGIEGQRKGDLNDGTFLNPILAGDYPDPSILKDGDDYFMTHSSFDASPGLVVWHSRDLPELESYGQSNTTGGW